MWKNPKKRKQILLLLVAANVVVFSVFYAMRWQKWREKREYYLTQFRESNKFSGSIYTDEELVRKYDIEDSVTAHQESISDADLDWCFRTMDAPAKTPDDVGFRRHNMCTILQSCAARMTETQKDRVFTKMVSVMQKDNPNDENAFDVVSAVGVFRELKDRRALSYLKPLLKDKRGWASGTAQEAINAIENCKEGCKG